MSLIYLHGTCACITKKETTKFYFKDCLNLLTKRSVFLPISVEKHTFFKKFARTYSTKAAGGEGVQVD